MIKKLFKTAFIFSICVCVAFPTCAAISVSDGSAFVTKAEFAADLNNLSSRMAQLENSLDAKIDSLVSSYLTRNGIWNGSKQTIINNQCSAYYTLAKYTGYLRSWSIASGAVNAQSYYVANDGYKKPSSKSRQTRQAFTNPLNKSGLLYCQFDVQAYTWESITIIPFNTSNVNTYMQSMNGYYTDWMQITNQDNIVLYRDETCLGKVVGGRYYLELYNDKIIFFFVTKEDVLYFETDVTMNYGNIVTDGSPNQFGRKWIFKELSVY